MVYWFGFNATNISNVKTPKNFYIEWQTDTMKGESRGTAFAPYFWEWVQYIMYLCVVGKSYTAPYGVTPAL